MTGPAGTAHLRRDAFWGRLEAAIHRVPEHARTPPPEARVGAVLVLLEDTPDGPEVVLTRRRRDLRSHPGQVSFPGGRLDPGETIEQAALREAHEEIGLRAGTVDVIGAGPTFYIPPSRFWVVPVVARWREPHELTENPWEVDEVLRVPIAQLLDRARWRHVPLTLRGSSWAWQLDEDLLWGATAIVMTSLLDVAVEGWNRGLAPEELGEDVAVRPWESAPSWQRRLRLDGELPAVDQEAVPHVTAAQIRALRAWLDTHGVGPLARAEHAARAVAHAARRMLGGDTGGRRITVLSGPSANGAAGLASARLLAAAGADVRVLTVGAPRYPEQTHVLRASAVPVDAVDPPELTDTRTPGELVVDGMLGIGGTAPLRDLPAVAAAWLQRHDVPVLALELPSGLSADAGLDGSVVSADVTVAFGLPTRGVGDRLAHPFVGDLYLADLGVPAAAWAEVGVPADPLLFARGPLVRLTEDEAATDAGTPDQGLAPQPADGAPPRA